MSLTIKNNVSAEIVEKKSKFIANIFYVQTEKEAEERIKEIRKKYHDAKHHCFAYSIMQKDSILNRMSDDGEPSGTAGMPILNILMKKDLVNVLVVVTRYFGGILLGTGGLVKAYTDVTLSALEKASYLNEELGYEMELILEYQDFEKLQYYLQKNNISIVNVEYNEKINCKIELTNEEKEKILKCAKDGSLVLQKCTVLQEKLIKKFVDK